MTAIDHHPAPAPLPATIGQGTAVEQSRAVAEVQAAVIVAQQCPRSLTTARTLMQESCSLYALADQAFYRFRRGGQNVEGASIHLARELARCFGNVQYGIAELRRDDTAGESEMLAFAWDVQTNTRSTTTFIVPHRRDVTRNGEQTTDQLLSMRDIYENNSNMGSRRVRQMIMAILPPHFREEAIDRCKETLQRGDGRSVEERRDGAIAAFDRLGVELSRLEQKLGRPAARWDPYDLSHLRVVHRSIERGEIAVDDEFPPPRITAAEIHQNGRQDEAATVGAGDDPSGSGEAATSGSEPGGEPAAESSSSPGDQATIDEKANEIRALARKRKVRLGDILEQAGVSGTVEDLVEAGKADEAIAWLNEETE